MDDMQIQIARAPSRRSTTWKNFSLTWTELVERLKQVTRTGESMADYKAMAKTLRDDRKDIGGFVGGYLENGRRRKGAVKFRTLLTLDLDNSPKLEELERTLSSLGLALVAYPTHSSTPEKPRYRVVIPFGRKVTSEEYEPIARKISARIDIDAMDITTYEPERLMYWPSIPQDADDTVIVREGAAIDADAILNEYEDWHDASAWPTGKAESEAHERSMKRLGDPTKKNGIVGAFCSVYGIEEAIEHFIPEVYTPTNVEGRYTYAEGSTTGGAVVYGDEYLYSHHATDPAGNGHSLNAFDLVRIHKFGNLDDEAKPDTPVNRLPSYKAMCAFALKDEKVNAENSKELLASFDDSLCNDGIPKAEVEALDKSWLLGLEKDGQGKPYNNLKNILTIFENDPRVKDIVGRDRFANRVVLLKNPPWDKKAVKKGEKRGREWTDADTSSIRNWFARSYSMDKKDAIVDALAEISERNSFDSALEYLDRVRKNVTYDPFDEAVVQAARIFIEWLGAPDTEAVRQYTLMFLKGLVMRMLVPGIKFDYVLVLAGPQGIGKSQLLARLSGPDGAWFTDSIVEFSSKDTMVQLQGKTIAELPELTPYKRSEKEMSKAFLTRTSDKFRMPFGHFAQDFPRRNVFAGTTNETSFLKDRTGNRRFMVVECTKNGIGGKRIHDLPQDAFDKIIREILYLIEEKHDTDLVLPDSIAEEDERIKLSHMEGEEKKELVRMYLDKPRPPEEVWKRVDLDERRKFYDGRWTSEAAMMEEEVDDSAFLPPERVCTMEILMELFGKQKASISRADVTEVNEIMSGLKDWRYMDGRRVSFTFAGRQRYYERVLPESTKRGGTKGETEGGAD